MTNSVRGRGDQTGGNRRAHRRAALTAPVLIDSARSHQTGRCRDVSEGGLLIEVESELPVGTIVDLYFELPTGIAIEARAEVARRGERTLGMRFSALTREDQKAIQTYCEAWRATLLTKCARRVASLPSLRIIPCELSPAPSSQGERSTFDAREPDSGVRIRAAEQWQSPGSRSKSS